VLEVMRKLPFAACLSQGLRACYDAVPILLWRVKGRLFIVGTAAITVVLYDIAFPSETVRPLAAEQGVPTRPEP
jgi:uncharacterized membrane protein